MVKVTVSVFETCTQSLRHSEVAMRGAVTKAMQEAGIPFTWKMNEDRPRPAAPGKLTFSMTTWRINSASPGNRRKHDLPPESG